MPANNLFANLPSALPEELVEVLTESTHVRIERIVSTGHASPQGFWYDQVQHECVVVLKGRAKLLCEGDMAVELGPGDFLNTQPIGSIASSGRRRMSRPCGWPCISMGRQAVGTIAVLDLETRALLVQVIACRMRAQVTPTLRTNRPGKKGWFVLRLWARDVAHLSRASSGPRSQVARRRRSHVCRAGLDTYWWNFPGQLLVYPLSAPMPDGFLAEVTKFLNDFERYESDH